MSVVNGSVADVEGIFVVTVEISLVEDVAESVVEGMLDVAVSQP
jgi:hypothetical protein